MPFLKEARDNGAFIVVIDPRATTLARQADVHLAVQPGTDLAVALSIHRYLFEEGHAAQSFLDEHTHGAAELREKAQAVDVRARRRGQRYQRRLSCARSPSDTRRRRPRS